MEPIEDKIKHTLESLNGISRAKANPFLYDKVMHRMQAGSEQGFTLKPATIKLAIAFTVILVGLNVFSLINYNKSTADSSAKAFGREYFTYMNNF